MKLFDLFATLSLDSGNFDTGLSKAQKSVSNFSQKIKSGISTVVKVETAVAAAGVAAGTYIGKIGISYNRTIEDYTANMQTLLGGADKAEAKIQELSKMAAETPFELSHLADATQTLLAFGVDSEKSTKVLKSLGDISLGNSQKLETLTRAYGKMSSTGKVTLENVQMMIDAGFNPLNLVAERNNMTMENLYKAISDGKVPFSELEWAIEKATSAGGQFYNGMETASKTMSGRLATLSDNWSAFLGLVTKPAYNTIKDTFLPYAIDFIDRLTDAMSEDGLTGVWKTASAEIGKLGGNIADKITEYFDSDQAVTDLQAVTGKIAQLLTSGNVVLSDVLGFANDVVDKIAENFEDETVKENLSKIGEQLVKGAVTISSENVERTIKAANIALDIGTSLITGIGDYFATADLSSIVSAIASGIIKLGVSAIQALPSIGDAALKIAHGLVNGIVTALPDVGQSILDGFAALFSPSEQDALSAKLVTMREALKGLDNAINTAEFDYVNTMGKLESRASLAEQYLSTIEELEKKDKLTDEDYETWQNAVTALTNMYPDLTAFVDAETGLFTANTAEIRDNINALNELAKTKAMSNMLTALSESAAGYVENMVNANAALLEISQNAEAAGDRLSQFNRYFGSQPGGSVTPQTASVESLETLSANQTKLLEATEAGKTMLEEFYQVAQDGTAKLNTDYADTQTFATALQNQIEAVKSELEAQQAELEAQKTEAQAQVDAAQTQLDKVNAEKDTIMKAYDDLFANVDKNLETSGKTADELGELYVKQKESANAAALDIKSLVEKWNSVPKSYKTTYTIETIETKTETPSYRQGQKNIKNISPMNATAHATGLYEVPYDGYAAILHRGERVLTKAQADESRSRKGNRANPTDNYTINIQSTAESPSETAMYIKQAMRSLRFGQ